MPARRLITRRVEKPWGRHTLWPGFADPAPGAEPIGEIWFEDEGGGDQQLLVKYIFTDEKLSIQVHPDDEAARAAGYPCGKEEAWVILAAEPDATIAMGTHEPIDHAGLRAAALSGEIETLVDWKPVAAGDVYYSPAGTVHAIGAGITLVEVQQNVDVTYRLYDYGRPRELHLDAGLAVSDAKPFVSPFTPEDAGDGRTILAEGRKFVLERWSFEGERRVSLPEGVPGWFTPVSGAGRIGQSVWAAGECWALEGGETIQAGARSDMLFAYALPKRVDIFADT